jgi:hypothetical protein
MADLTVTTSTRLQNTDSIDLDRLGASLDHLSALFGQTGAENNATPPSSDVCDCVPGSDGDPHVGNFDKPAAPERNGHDWQASNPYPALSREHRKDPSEGLNLTGIRSQ